MLAPHKGAGGVSGRWGPDPFGFARGSYAGRGMWGDGEPDLRGLAKHGVSRGW